MADIKLFNVNDKVVELSATSVSLEKELQTLIEKNMEVFFGVKFLKSEYSIANGRIDSLGLDENKCPVIFEYKRSSSENVINQGLFYLDWLLDHKADFKMLVMDIINVDSANAIDWSMPCVICIANDFTKFDEHAVNQMQRNIKLVRYRKYANNLILFEHLNAPKVKPLVEGIEMDITPATSKQNNIKTFAEQLQTAPTPILNIYGSISDYILSLGDDVSENKLKLYTAFKKVKNIACIEIRMKSVMLYLRLNPDEVELKENFIRDVRNIGHWGTGDIEITIKHIDDFEKAKIYIDKAYNEN